MTIGQSKLPHRSPTRCAFKADFPPTARFIRRALCTASVIVAIIAGGCKTDAESANAAPHPDHAAEIKPVPGGPVLLRENISLREVIGVGGGSIKLIQHPLNGDLYTLSPAAGIFRITLSDPPTAELAATIREITPDGSPSGMAFGPDGTLYFVTNRKPRRTMTQAIVFKGTPTTSGGFAWEILATTEPYQASNTQFDHLFNGIVVSPDGSRLFLNSGSRTDHGEVQNTSGSFPETREVDLTAKILVISAAETEQRLPNDRGALEAQGFLFAEGTRNAYDLAFAPNGELFAVDNGPDADYPDELNWIREGKHYGFPWRFGSQNNPQQFDDYDAGQDKRLNNDFMAVQTGSYRNDPGFPPPPGVFIDPVVNLGPAAAVFRGDDGREYDAAAAGQSLATFTPHRSPLGLVFAADSELPADLQGDGNSLSAFILSWGAAGGNLSDKGQDLLHLRLTKRGDHYEAVTTQVARGFRQPIDVVIIENRLYILEYGANGALWELIFN